MGRHRAGRAGRPTALLLAASIAVVGIPAAAVGATTAPATTGSIGLRLVDAPAATREDPRAQQYIVDHLPPGTVIRRRVEVANTTASAVRVVLYAAGAAIARGTFLGAAGRTPNDLSTWTAVVPGEIAVPAGGRALSTVTVAVPRDAAPGERYAVAWAEVRSDSATDGVVQVNRVGLRLYVSVGAGAPPAADFAIETLTAERSPDRGPLVRAAVRNTGGRALDLSGSLRLVDGPGGLTAGPFPVSLGTTLGIGEAEPVTMVLHDQMPAGPWDARIVLRSGLLERDARATITFPAAGSAAPVATSADRPGWLYPAVGGILLSIAALLALLTWRRLRRRHADDSPRSPAAAR